MHHQELNKYCEGGVRGCQTYSFKWLGPSSLQRSYTGALQQLVTQISFKRDFALAFP